MAYNWQTGSFDYAPSMQGNNAYSGGMAGITSANTYDTSNSSSNNSRTGSYWTDAGTGIGNYNQGYASGDSTSGAISGAASGYQSGGWVGAIAGALSGWYGGKEGEKDKKKGELTFEQRMELQLAQSKYEEEVRQKKMEETRKAFQMYTPKTAPAATFNYGNGLLGGNGMNGMFSPQVQPTQPVVDPLANSYGLLRG